MQWRIALSWISGYFAYSLFTPVLFHYQGAVVAGQMGMTWAFVGALVTVHRAGLAPRAPTFGMLIAQRKYGELDRIFWQTLIGVIVVTTLGALALWLAVFTLNVLQNPFAARLLPPTPTGFMLLASILVATSLTMERIFALTRGNLCYRFPSSLDF